VSRDTFVDVDARAAIEAVILVVSIATLSQDSQPVLDKAYQQNPQLVGVPVDIAKSPFEFASAEPTPAMLTRS
jgi:hypothetical protein